MAADTDEPNQTLPASVNGRLQGTVFTGEGIQPREIKNIVQAPLIHIVGMSSIQTFFQLPARAFFGGIQRFGGDPHLRSAMSDDLAQTGFRLSP